MPQELTEKAENLRCSVRNPATNRFCSACGMALDRETADQMLENDRARQQADTLLDQSMGDEEFRGLFMRKMHDLAQQRPIRLPAERANGVNPFDYLTELQKHQEEVKTAPQDWMP